MYRNLLSGKDSKRLWKLINKIMWNKGKVGEGKKTKRKKLRRRVWHAVYLMGCKCQELESVVQRLIERR